MGKGLCLSGINVDGLSFKYEQLVNSALLFSIVIESQHQNLPNLSNVFYVK